MNNTIKPSNYIEDDWSGLSTEEEVGEIPEEEWKQIEQWHNEYRVYVDKLRKTPGYRKAQNHFKSVIKKKDFIEKVKNLRNKYRIPDSGYSFPDEENDEPWPRTVIENFDTDLRELALDFALETSSNPNPLRMHVIYGIDDELTDVQFSDNLFLLEDYEKLKFQDQKVQAEHNALWPVILRISPYATANDIRSYIAELYSEIIEPMQKKYRKTGIKLKRINQKPELNQKIIELIVSNPDKLSDKVLAKRVTELVKTHDPKSGRIFSYSDIAKIRYNEKRKIT